MRLPATLFIALVTHGLVHAQRDVPVRVKALQVSLAPGLGSNGLHPGSFENIISLNITSGYSAGTLLFELGGISNLNTNRTNGVQFGGLVNLTGANAFGALNRKEREEKIKNGFEANLTGAQFSGAANVVTNNVFGLQAAGGANVAKGALIGVQLSAISNVVYKFSFGVQTAGVFNISAGSMDGVQLAGAWNYTRGELSGIQVAAFNQAGHMEGKNSYERTRTTALQLGLFNWASRMDGFQVGLVNFARRSQGTQIGLINIYKGGTRVESRNGTAIGLVNAGDVDYVAVYISDLFALNYEISTGTRKNMRIKNESRNIYVTNALIFSHQPFTGESWAFGYGLKKLYLNRSTVPGMMEFRFFGYGLDIQHINTTRKKLTHELSLLTRLKAIAGTRLHPRIGSVYVFASAGLNAFWSEEGSRLAPALEGSATLANTHVEYWPAYAFGILLH